MARPWGAQRAANMITVGLAFIALFAAGPHLLSWIAPEGLNWQKLSLISQTYGAVSVVISAAALLGVVVSISLQARQSRMEGEQTFRAAHRELTILTLGDSALMRCWEPPRIPMTEERRKQVIVTNLIMSMWSSDHRLMRINDQAMRVALDGHFRGEVARVHWENSGPSWRANVTAVGDPHGTRFVDLVDAAYTAAVASGPPVTDGQYFIDPEAATRSGNGSS
ncbi:DUF6082 family protein [Streptomyces sp. NPDC023998]|uniref:DUF6082 family protein n=1 Tax=Streptomyces sp. NPDC023998 TaxID=3154597 RepID=UPI0033D4B051